MERLCHSFKIFYLFWADIIKKINFWWVLSWCFSTFKVVMCDTVQWHGSCALLFLLVSNLLCDHLHLLGVVDYAYYLSLHPLKLIKTVKQEKFLAYSELDVYHAYTFPLSSLLLIWTQEHKHHCTYCLQIGSKDFPCELALFVMPFMSREKLQLPFYFVELCPVKSN